MARKEKYSYALLFTCSLLIIIRITIDECNFRESNHVHTQSSQPDKHAQLLWQLLLNRHWEIRS